MNNDKLRKKIEGLGEWYQNVKFNDEVASVSKHSKLSGEYAWNYIKQLLPESLEGKRVLDLGCNAGLFTVRSAQMGAKEVIGVERNPIHVKQSNFLKKYFNVPSAKFIVWDLEKLFDMNLGKFDIILAISVLYWVGRNGVIPKGTHYDKKYRDIEKQFIKRLVTMSDTFIVRVRGQEKYNTCEYYSKVFDYHDFRLAEALYEDTGTHEMLLFEKRKPGDSKAVVSHPSWEGKPSKLEVFDDSHKLSKSIEVHKRGLEAGLRLPEIYHIKENKDKFYKYTEWVSGTEIRYVMRDNPSLIEPICKDLGKYMAELYDVDGITPRDCHFLNFVWHDDKEVVYIDMKKLLFEDFEGHLEHMAKLCLKSCRGNRKMALNILKGYTACKDITPVLEECSMRSWEWQTIRDGVFRIEPIFVEEIADGV